MNKKFHFIAIGGIGMSGLAKYLIENGYEVSGSDVSDSKYLMALRKRGARIFIGHDKNNLPSDCTVIVSTAVKKDNPELLEAKTLGLPIYHRSDLLAKIAHNNTKKFIGFSGTHGKTTTSGLCSYVLEKAGFNPSFVNGGIVPELNTNAQCRKGNIFIAELDESDGTIIKYLPDIAVVNNLEADHIDYYKNGLYSLITTFHKFLAKLNKNSKVLLNIDDIGVQQLRDKISGEVYTFGLEEKADFIANNINYNSDFTTFDVYYKNQFLSEFKIILKGRHNVYNTLAVIASLHLTGIDVAAIKEHFASFNGMGRRFQYIGKLENHIKADIYDDYAHHPTEIKATLDAASSFKGRRIIAVFQPHRYTRLESLWSEFKLSLQNCEAFVVVTDVYAASEKPIENITGEKFALDIGAKYIGGEMKIVARKLFPYLKNGDIIIGMGAGTITELGKELMSLDKEVLSIDN